MITIDYSPKQSLEVHYNTLESAKKYHRFYSIYDSISIISCLVVVLMLVLADYFPIYALKLLILVPFNLIIFFSVRPFLKRKAVYTYYRFTPKELIYHNFAQGGLNKDSSKIYGLQRLVYNIKPIRNRFNLEIGTYKIIWFDNDLDVTNLKKIIDYIQELYEIDDYNEKQFQWNIEQKRAFTLHVKSKQYLKESIQDESIEYIPNTEIIIKEAYNKATTLRRPTVRFCKSIIYNTSKSYAYEAKELKTPFLLRIRIEHFENYFLFTIYYFEDELATFRWHNLVTIPKITDTIKEFYNLEFYSSNQINTNTEELIYISQVGRKSKQLFQLNNKNHELLLELNDISKSNIQFDWLNLQLKKMDEMTANAEIIPFVYIKNVHFHIKKDLDNKFFTTFAIEVHTHENKVINLVKFKDIHVKTEVKSITQIPPNWVFNAVMELFKILKSKEEISEIQMKLLT